MCDLHGRVIHYNDIPKILPKRKYFLNKNIYNKVSENIKREKKLPEVFTKQTLV